MNAKNIILSALSVCLISNAFAQDKIFETNGAVIDARIKTVGANSVTYKPWNNQNGPDYVIAKADIDKIRYENGSEENFNHDGLVNAPPASQGFRSQPRANIDFQPARLMLLNRILYVSPFQFTDNGVGLKLGYEKGIDKEGIIAYEIPVVLTFNLNHTNLIGNKEDPMFYVMPGLKFYPTSSYGKVKYSLGPSVVLGVGQKTTYNYDYNSGNPTYNTQSHLQLGMILNNSVNFNPTSRFYLGLDFGFGFNYLDKVGGINQGFTGLVQGGFKMGIRY